MWQTIVGLCLHITLILFLCLSSAPSLHPVSQTRGKGLNADRYEHTHMYTESMQRVWVLVEA